MFNILRTTKAEKLLPCVLVRGIKELLFNGLQFDYVVLTFDAIGNIYQMSGLLNV